MHRERFLEEAGSPSETEKRQGDDRWQPDRFGSGNDRFQPCLRPSVVWRILVDGIYEQIDVDNDHLRKAIFLPSSSSSIAVAASRALSQRKF